MPLIDCRLADITTHHTQSEAITMEPELHVYYTNGYIDDFCGTKVRTVSNLRRHAKSLIVDQDIAAAILFYTDDNGLSQEETYGHVITG